MQNRKQKNKKQENENKNDCSITQTEMTEVGSPILYSRKFLMGVNFMNFAIL